MAIDVVEEKNKATEVISVKSSVIQKESHEKLSEWTCMVSFDESHEIENFC